MKKKALLVNFSNSNSIIRLFLLHAVYRLKCWELKQRRRRRQRERLKKQLVKGLFTWRGGTLVRWNNPLR